MMLDMQDSHFDHEMLTYLSDFYVWSHHFLFHRDLYRYIVTCCREMIVCVKKSFVGLPRNCSFMVFFFFLKMQT